MAIRDMLPPAFFLLTVTALSCGRDPVPGPAPAPAAAPPARALAQARAEWPELTVDVLEVSQANGTVLVRLRFSNASGLPFEFGSRFAAQPEDRDTLSGVALLDSSGRRKYFVLRDRENRPLCSTGLAPLAAGEKREVFARFPAPAAASRITIQVPHVPDMRDVAVGSR